MIRILIITAVAMVAGFLSISMASAQSPPAAERAEMTVQERLAACERRYVEAKTYRDEGEVAIEFKTGRSFADKRPFTTAFERDGRFRWEFKGSASPGGRPTQTYIVWSKDQKKFHSYWTLGDQRQTHNGISTAMAGPTGVSGGSATAVIPLLFKNRHTLRTTEIADAKETGIEKIDGHDCVKIEGDSRMGRITLWLDETHAIRKIHQVKEIDPSELPPPPGREAPRTEKFTTVTTITIKPVFDEPIEDDRFAPPAGAE